jgi:hypothetical protein
MLQVSMQVAVEKVVYVALRLGSIVNWKRDEKGFGWRFKEWYSQKLGRMWREMSP